MIPVLEFSRPIRWLVALLGRIRLFPVQLAGRTGRSLHTWVIGREGSRLIELSAAADYLEKTMQKNTAISLISPKRGADRISKNFFDPEIRFGYRTQ